MRISDWSSDVCSSDLSPVAAPSDQNLPHSHDRARLPTPSLCCDVDATIWQSALPCHNRYVESGQSPASMNADRKSVELGKSVSERVDTGGRRIIIKQIYTKINSTNIIIFQ